MSSAKERQTVNILKYLGDPENKWLTRSDLSLEVCGYKDPNTIYKLFSPDELTEIEEQAAEERKRRCAPQRMRVYESLYNQALLGNVQAAKEFLDRVEGKVQSKIDLTGELSRTTSITVEVVRPGDVE